MTGHFSMEETTGSLVIRIRHAKSANIPVIVFLFFWLGGWTFGELFALTSLLDHSSHWTEKLFFIIWVIPWTAGGLFAVLSVLKLTGGRELIEVGRGILSVRRTFVFFSIVRRYDIFRITDLHAIDKDPRKFYLRNSGVIQFQYEGRDVRFGYGLEGHEKWDLLEKLHQHRDFSDKNFRK